MILRRLSYGPCVAEILVSFLGLVASLIPSVVYTYPFWGAKAYVDNGRDRCQVGSRDEEHARQVVRRSCRVIFAWLTNNAGRWQDSEHESAYPSSQRKYWDPAGIHQCFHSPPQLPLSRRPCGTISPRAWLCRCAVGRRSGSSGRQAQIRFGGRLTAQGAVGSLVLQIGRVELLYTDSVDYSDLRCGPFSTARCGPAFAMPWPQERKRLENGNNTGYKHAVRLLSHFRHVLLTGRAGRVES